MLILLCISARNRTEIRENYQRRRRRRKLTAFLLSSNARDRAEEGCVARRARSSYAGVTKLKYIGRGFSINFTISPEQLSARTKREHIIPFFPPLRPRSRSFYTSKSGYIYIYGEERSFASCTESRGLYTIPRACNARHTATAEAAAANEDGRNSTFSEIC